MELSATSPRETDQSSTVSIGIGRTSGYTALTAIIALTVQIIVLLVALALSVSRNAEFDLEQWSASAPTDGTIASASIILTAMVCVPFMKVLVQGRVPSPWAFLGIGAIQVRVVLLWCLIAVAFGAAMDAVTILLGRPVNSEFMVAIASSAHPLLLVVALVLAAPLFEELLFRGLLLGGLQTSGVSFVVAAGLSTFLFALVHVQYGAYDQFQVFLIGLLLAIARWRTRSLVPPLAMHACVNAVAVVQVLRSVS